MALNEILNSAKDKIGDIHQHFAKATDFFSEEEKSSIINSFKTKGSERLNELITDLENSMSVITEAGYDFNQFSVDLGIPPSVSFSFHFNNNIENEKRVTLLNDHKENKSLILLLNLLFKASDFITQLPSGTFSCESVQISLGLSPDMQIQFKKKTS